MMQLYYGGTILTMDEQQEAEAVLVEDGKIKKIGRFDEIVSDLDSATERINLDGHILLPAFIDSHSHITSYAMSLLQIDMEGTTSNRDIADRLTAHIQDNPLSDGEWLIATGYDQTQLLERKHPSAEFLDSMFQNNPVLLQHKSGHFGVMNTAALKKLQLKDQHPDGFLQESEFIAASKKTPMPSFEKILGAYARAQNKYASYGITTVQDGMIVSQMLQLYQGLLQSKTFYLDVVGYPELQDADKIYSQLADYADSYKDSFRLGGYKIILDGSPQGRTAWMRTPYKKGSESDCSGPAMTDEMVSQAFEKAIHDRRQLLAHCNGDAASEQLIRSAEHIGNTDALHQIRPVIIHAQLLGIDQLEDVKRLGLIPSFFVAHVYYWGDIHINNFGIDRASHISPAASCKHMGIPFTFHQDSPVIEPNMLDTIWCAVTRKTKDGIVLGENEKITPIQALKAVTANAAYQYGEENEKGTISVGKNADFVILERNPLTTQPDEIRNIKVLETIKKGVTIFSNTNQVTE